MLVDAPIAVPTALVRRPTDAEQLAAEVGCLPCGTSPSEPAKLISRSNCAVTTCAQRLELGSDGRAGKPEHPGEEAEAEQQGQCQPPARAESGRTRPSSRTPPSRNTAKIAPPMISSSGWASTMIPTIASVMPSHTAALAISRRTKGSRNSAGPGRSTCGSTVGGLAPSAVPQRRSGAAVAERLEPGQRVPPHGRCRRARR